VPPIAALTDQPFYLDLFRRMMIFAIAAVSLDLILGYGGMVSFGHAAYLGIGAYAVGHPAFYGIHSGLVQWPLAVGLSALVGAADRGGVAAHERRVLHHDHAGVRADAVLPRHLHQRLGRRRRHAPGAAQPVRRRARLGNAVVFYYVVLALLVGLLWVGHRLVHARFGLVIRRRSPTSRACAPSDSRPIATSWRRSCSAGRRAAWPARCWPTRPNT
jgi:branched-chain amino acid transport system permease protein